jgi:Bacterial protein of unknown function (DUF948)
VNAGQLAALIAAAFFAIGVCAGVWVLIRLGRLISAATAAVTRYQDGADELLRRAHAAVDRADEQLARTGALTQSVEQVTASMGDLSEQVSAVAGTARLIAAGLGTPALRLAAAGHGVRRALAVRRSASAVQAPGRHGKRRSLMSGSLAPSDRPVRTRALPDRPASDRPASDRPAPERAVR